MVEPADAFGLFSLMIGLAYMYFGVRGFIQKEAKVGGGSRAYIATSQPWVGLVSGFRTAAGVFCLVWALLLLVGGLGFTRVEAMGLPVIGVMVGEYLARLAIGAVAAG